MVTIQQPPFDLAALRDEFLPTHRGMTYLNHAGMSPLPLRAARAMEHAARLMAEQGSGIYQDFNPGIKRSLRARLAELVNARPDEIAFVESTSMGINLLANSLPIHAGDNVIVCDVEFPSNVYPWQNLTGKGIEARLVPAVEGGLSLEQVEAVRDGRTQAVAVSAVQFFTGRMEDLAAIGAYCRAHDLWLVVDAIQAAGVVELDMRAMNIHVLAAGGQKALMGPPGQGFMAIREDLLAELSPAFVGPVSVVDYE
ncbi:MAG: aminotransferase class V-fold PLP-dependent enzyme, partial [Chloroflexi bacterium]|nr:aminotransferase class V-fold PLP-dependent enzyme [Chloroflexota bacterium]